MERRGSIAILGATGAVGSQVAAALLRTSQTTRLTTLGRRPLDSLDDSRVDQYIVDVFEPGSYQSHLTDTDAAICTLGVGEPSKVSREQFVKIDKTAVLDFATAAKQAGVRHFQLLSSVGVSSNSRSFFLRTKGELEDGLRDLGFERLSLFHPSMILTPTNRYGWTQGVVLKVWPLLKPVLVGPLRKYRGVAVQVLGEAIAANVFTDGHEVEVLEWTDIQRLAGAV